MRTLHTSCGEMVTKGPPVVSTVCSAENTFWALNYSAMGILLKAFPLPSHQPYFLPFPLNAYCYKHLLSELILKLCSEHLENSPCTCNQATEQITLYSFSFLFSFYLSLFLAFANYITI